MKFEKSCGVIPFCFANDKIKVVLVKQNNGVIGFPKGHVEENESEEETALRECKEEISAVPSLIDGFKEEISYYMPEYDANKAVVFFVGIINDTSFTRQESEISDVFVMDIQSALDVISYDDTKELLKKAFEFLKQKDNKFANR